MADDTNTPRRRKLPALGMTTVGLAVGAGSLGLYRGAEAVPLPPADQPTWTTAEAKPPARAETPEVAMPDLTPPVIPAAAVEEPPVTVVVPPLPVVPALPPLGGVPVLPPPRPEDATPVLPVAPSGPLIPASPVQSITELPKPTPVVPVLPAPAAVKPAEPEVAPAPRPHRDAPKAAPAPQLMQVAPQEPLVTPIAPVAPLFNLPPPQPGFSVNGTPAAAPAMPAAGALASLSPGHPGDTPVITPMQALKSAAVGAALAASPLSAAEAPAKMPVAVDAPKDAPKDDPVAELKKQVEELRKDADLQKKFREVTDDAVLGKRNNETGKTEPGLKTKFDELDARLKRIEESLKTVDVSKFEQTLKRLEAKLNDLDKTTTTTQKPEIKDAAPKPMPGPGSPTILGAKATVRIINEYPVPISMMVNGVSHRVEPNNSKTVDVPAGTYTYELLHAGSQPTTATIKENEPVTLRIK